MKHPEPPGQFRGPAEVRFVRTLPGPIERVWAYLTDPEKRARWLAGGPMEPRVGGKVQLTFRHKDLAPGETPPPGMEQHHEPGSTMACVVTRWEPPHVLAYTFGGDDESEATFELTTEGRNVRLVLTHRATGGDLPYMSSFGAGWHTHFSLLAAELEGAPRPPFWPTWLRLKDEYEQARRAAEHGAVSK